jgi:hypothetical protein
MTPEESQFLEESVGRIPDSEEYDDYGWVMLCTLLEVISVHIFHAFHVHILTVVEKSAWTGFHMLFKCVPCGLWASLTLMFIYCKYKHFMQLILLVSWLAAEYNFSFTETVFVFIMRDRSGVIVSVCDIYLLIQQSFILIVHEPTKEKRVRDLSQKTCHYVT